MKHPGLSINARLWLLAAAAAAATLFVVLRPRTSSTGRVEYRVTRKTVGHSLLERGILVSSETVPVDLEASGEIIEIAKSGSRVRKGDVILRVDDRELNDRIEDRVLDVQRAQIDKGMYEAEYELITLTEKNNLELLGQKLDMARFEKQTAVAGLTSEQRRLLEIDRSIANLNYQDAVDELARQKRLQTKGFISASMLEPFERRMESALASLEEEDVKIRLREQTVTPEALIELKQTVKRLQAQFERSEKAMQRKLAYIQNKIAVSKAEIEKHTVNADRLKEEVKHTAVTAKLDGVMSVRLYRNWRSRGRWVEYKAGLKKWIYDRVADIVKPGVMTVSLMIHEADVRKIKTGMPAGIRLPAYPGKRFSGEVLEVGGVGRDRFDIAPSGQESGRTGVTVFNASVSCNSDGVEFRPGMSALVELIMDPPSPKLVIPRPFVRRTENEFWTLLKGSAGFRKTVIRGAWQNEQYFRVEEGLKEGDVIAR